MKKEQKCLVINLGDEVIEISINKGSKVETILGFIHAILN